MPLPCIHVVDTVGYSIYVIVVYRVLHSVYRTLVWCRATTSGYTYYLSDLDLLVDLHTGVLASDTRSEVYQYMSRYTDYTSTPHTCTSIHLVCMVYTVMVGVIHVYTYMYGGVRLVVYL